MKHYVVRIWTVQTVAADSNESAELMATKAVWANLTGTLWGTVVLDSWSDNETLEDVNHDIQEEKNRVTLKLEDATREQLHPRSWIYLERGPTLYVARLGSADDWVAYQGPLSWGVCGVANNGYKLMEEDAVPLFPLLAESHLTYRH